MAMVFLKKTQILNALIYFFTSALTWEPRILYFCLKYCLSKPSRRYTLTHVVIVSLVLLFITSCGHWISNGCNLFSVKWSSYYVQRVGLKPIILARSERTNKKVVLFQNKKVSTHSCIFVNRWNMWVVYVSNESLGTWAHCKTLLKAYFESMCELKYMK